MSYLSGRSARSDSAACSLPCRARRSASTNVHARLARREDGDEPLREARGILRAVGLGACFWAVVALIWLLA